MRIAKKGDAPRYQSTLYECGEVIAVVLTLMILLFAFVGRVFNVVGSSMVPTLQNSDKLLVSNAFYTPKKGDVVVLAKRSFENGEPIVKRVIATAGDTVDINFMTGAVEINGQTQNEPYLAERTRTALDMTGSVTVPAGCVFVMGDNRNHSTDSRDSRIGMVDTRYLLGHVLLRMMPVSRAGAIGQITGGIKA